MDFKNWIINESKDSIDNLKFGRTTDETHLRNAPTPFFGKDWKKWTLNPPPKNSSKTTAKELKYIANKQKSLTKEQKEVIKRQDNFNPEKEFFYLLEDLGKKLSKKEKEHVTKIMEELTTIVTFFKEHFDRPRPYQLMNVVYPDFPKLKTKIGSAAYPSGHALIGKFLALYLSDLYPEYKKELEKLGEELGLNRVLGGFHYLSDFEAGVDLAKKLFKNLKSKII